MSVESSMVTPPITPATNTVQSSNVNAAQATGVENTPAAQEDAGIEQAGLSVEKLQAAVDRMNELMQNGQRSLNFSVDSSTDQVVVKVVDMQTNEVVRQIPNEETLKFAEYIEGMVGLIFDKQA